MDYSHLHERHRFLSVSGFPLGRHQEPIRIPARINLPLLKWAFDIAVAVSGLGGCKLRRGHCLSLVFGQFPPAIEALWGYLWLPPIYAFLDSNVGSS